MDSSMFEFRHVHYCKLGVCQKSRTVANGEDPDEMAHHEPSHLDLHCLQRYLFWPASLKRLIPEVFCFM